MRFFGLISMLISLAVIGYLMMKQTKPWAKEPSAKLKKFQDEQGIELPAEILNNGDLTKLPAAIKKDLERKMKERTVDIQD